MHPLLFCLNLTSPSASLLIQAVFFSRLPQIPKSNIRRKIEVDAKRRKVGAISTLTHPISFILCMIHSTVSSFITRCLASSSLLQLLCYSVILFEKLVGSSIKLMTVKTEDSGISNVFHDGYVHTL